MDNSQKITHISLCAGYAGIDIGLKRAIPNLRTIAFSEIEAFACANLVSKMEEGLVDSAPIWTDLKTFPWESFRDVVDILSGGFPCQPFSCAGKRDGDEDTRHLFPYILEGIKQCRPSVVFLENVEGILSAKLNGEQWRDPAGTPVLLHVLRELERVGYRATAGVFSASEIGAPHQRKRVFIMAYRHGFRGEAGISGSEPWNEGVTGVSDNHSGQGVWPSRPGEPQHEWEPPRVVNSKSRRISRGQESIRETEPSGPGEEGPADGSSEPPRVVVNATGIRPCGRRKDGPGEQSEVLGSGFESTRITANGNGTDRGPSPEGLGASELENSFGTGSGGESGNSLHEGGIARQARGESLPSATGRSLGASESNHQPTSGDGGEELGDSPGERSQARSRHIRGETSPCSSQECHAEPSFTSSDLGDQRQAEPPMGGDADGASDWLGYAELCVSCDNRTDELRLLGNGVVPATAELAWRTLFKELNKKK